MGDQDSILSAGEARHLLRRTGFGMLKKDFDLTVGQKRGVAIDRLLNFKATGFKPSGLDFDAAHNKWVKYLLKPKFPLQEKLVLFWHDHFATAFTKVQDASLMGLQIQTLHKLCKGSMKDLVKAINKDPAMIEFLDTRRNHRDEPNENYARELQELFTLGVFDVAGNPNYAQEDIVQIARAFTGWSYNRTRPTFDQSDHDFEADFPERGSKVIYRSSGGFGAGGQSYAVNGEGEPEIDTIIDIIFAHRDTDGKNTVARRTAKRLLEYFAHPNPSNAVVDTVVAQSGFDTSFNIQALVRAIVVHDAFYETAAPAPFGAGTKKSVKWPIDFVVGTIRTLGMKLKGHDLFVNGGDSLRSLDYLENMGQLLLDPPSVFGWDWETSWISSATLLARYEFARDLVASRNGGGSAFRPDKLMDLNLTNPAQIIDAVLGVLGVPDQFTSTEKNAFVAYLTDDGAVPSLDLLDFDIRNTKLHGLFALVMQAPAFQVH